MACGAARACCEARRFVTKAHAVAVYIYAVAVHAMRGEPEVQQGGSLRGHMRGGMCSLPSSAQTVSS